MTQRPSSDTTHSSELAGRRRTTLAEINVDVSPPFQTVTDQFAPQSVYVPRKGEVNAWAVDAKAAGFKVYAVIDDQATRAKWLRARQSRGLGVIPTSTNAVLSEAHRTWNRSEAGELAKLYALVAPNYAAVMES